MTRPPETLAGVDAQVYGLLQRIVAIGRHRRAWAPKDVVRVSYDHLPHPHALDRRLASERRRADAAEATVRRLREQLTAALNARQPKPMLVVQASDDGMPPREVVELSRSQYEAFAEWAAGVPYQQIADELGLALGTVKNAVAHAAERIDPHGPRRAAALVNRGVVLIRPKADRRRNAA